MPDEASAQPAETEKDFGTDTGADARRWLAELQAAEAGEVASYISRCRTIERRYKEERGIDDKLRQYAMLWANVSTLQPAAYSRVPKPVVTTRYKDGDPVARTAAEVLERALTYSLDTYDFNGRMEAARDDFLLYARSVLWVRYVPTMEGDQVTYDEVQCDFVNLEDFLTNKARTWQEVRWGARRVYMTRQELIDRFGQDKGSRVSLDHEARKLDRHEQGLPDDMYRKATVYEIWDRNKREVVWVAKSFTESLLDKRPDPLKLRDFFPFPKPAYGTVTTSSLIPIPDYIFYQDQAEEVDTLTQRISILTSALKMVGAYAADEKSALGRMLESGRENELIPVEGWAVWAEKGGVRGLIEWLPVDMVATVLQGCIATRRQLIEDVYQVTGISDIVRGASDPRETATAQGLKGQWGSLRIRTRQAELQRLARDVIRIKGEIIAEMFGQDTLAAMSGIKLPTREERQVAQLQLQVMQAAAAEVDPMTGQPAQQPDPAQQAELERVANAPVTWDDVIELLRADPLRRFLIDVETDSTIQADEQEEKGQRIEFVQAVSAFLQQAAPVVQAAPELSEMVGEILLFGVRSFRAGRTLEEAIERGMQALGERGKAMQQQAQQPQQDPAAEQKAASVQAKAEADMAKVQATTQLSMVKAETDQQRNQIEMFKAETERGAAQADLLLRKRDQQLKAATLAVDPAPQSIG